MWCRPQMNEVEARAYFEQQYVNLKSRISGEYTFKFNNNLARAAVCKFSTDSLSGIIEVSRHYLRHPKTTPDVLKNTILHELAHAIAGHEAGHGPKWKSVAREIGCDAERLTHVFRPEDTYKYFIRCPAGCKQNRTRLAKYMLRGRFCCRQHNKPISIFQRNKQGKLTLYN